MMLSLMQQKIEIAQFDATFTVTGTIRGTYRNKNNFSEDLGSESLKSSRCFRKFSLFSKILSLLSTEFLSYRPSVLQETL